MQGQQGSSMAGTGRGVKRALSAQVLALLELHPHIVMDDGFDGSEDRLEEPDPEEGEAKVWGNMVAFLERLDDELFKSLQARPRYACGLDRGSIMSVFSYQPLPLPGTWTMCLTRREPAGARA